VRNHGRVPIKPITGPANEGEARVAAPRHPEPSEPDVPPQRSHAAPPRCLEPLRDEGLLEELRTHTWSASSLELWTRCPVRWFVERMLRAQDLDPHPEPLARGGLAHAALKDTFEGLRRETGSARLTPTRLPRARELLKAALREHQHEFPLSSAPERVPGARRRLEVDLERYLGNGVLEPSPLEPSHFELTFGFDELPDSLPALDLGEGLRLRGRIDRVDIGAGGEAVVYDYKGRSATPGAKWIEQGSIQVALYMRVVQELLGLRVVGGFYQPLAGADLRARGALDADSELDCVRSDRLERAELEGLLGEAVAAAKRAAAQARRGALQARPRTCSFRGGCTHPTICRCE
jgi:ATP-dependent helicase/DNAse subunit B